MSMFNFMDHPERGRVRFWISLMGFFSLLTLAAVAVPLLRHRGADDAITLAIIPSFFVLLCGLALHSVIRPPAPRRKSRVMIRHHRSNPKTLHDVGYDTPRWIDGEGWFSNALPLRPNEIGLESPRQEPLRSTFDDDALRSGFSEDTFPKINPASGLPMVGAVDTEGNAYGCSELDHFTQQDDFNSHDNVFNHDNFTRHDWY